MRAPRLPRACGPAARRDAATRLPQPPSTGRRSRPCGRHRSGATRSRRASVHVLQRKADLQDGTPFGCLDHISVTAVLVCDGAHDEQPEPAAGTVLVADRTPSAELLEDVLAHVLGDPRATVLDLHHGFIAVAPGAKIDRLL